MNKVLAGFLKAGYAVGKSIVPQIGMAEAVIVGIKKGPDRRKAVLEGVMLAPDIIELVSKGEIVDEDLFRRGVGKINDGYIDVLNSFRQTP